jgi:DNA-binding GntR family transcriptional regulator
VTVADPGAQPVAYKSKAEAVYAEVRRRILEGEIAPSSSLHQEQLAAALGVSTTPLREALRQLESEGFVRSTTHREMIVAPLELNELIWLYEVRENLDPLAAALAAERHSAEQGQQIAAAAEELRRDDGKDALRFNRDFHTAIYRSCGNPVLIDLLDSLWDRSDRYRHLVTFVARDVQVVAEHDALRQAVLDRRPDEAAHLMREHLRSARELIESSLKTGTDSSPTPA